MNWLLLGLIVMTAVGAGVSAEQTSKPAAKATDQDGSKSAPERSDKRNTAESTDPAKSNQGADKAEATKVKKVFDTSYVPTVGDRAVLYCRDEKGEEEFEIWVCKTPESFREYAKAYFMESETRMNQLEKKGNALILDEETQVGITGVEAFTILIGDRVAGNLCVRIQVLSGPQKGKVLYTVPDNIAQVRYIPTEPGNAGRRVRGKSTTKKTQAKPPAIVKTRPADPAARAASLFKLGQALEKAGKSAGAVDLYRQIAKQYPKTPHAKDAAARIDALTKR